MSHALFVYGTLMDPDIRALVLGHSVPAGDIAPAVVADHRIVFYPGRSYPAIVPLVGAAAAGLLLTGLAPADLRFLDAFEGDRYRRDIVRVSVLAREVGAHCYWPSVAVAADAPIWTFEHWQRNHKAAMLVSEAPSAVALRQRLVGVRSGEA